MMVVGTEVAASDVMGPEVADTIGDVVPLEKLDVDPEDDVGVVLPLPLPLRLRVPSEELDSRGPARLVTAIAVRGVTTIELVGEVVVEAEVGEVRDAITVGEREKPLPEELREWAVDGGALLLVPEKEDAGRRMAETLGDVDIETGGGEDVEGRDVEENSVVAVEENEPC